MEKAILLATQSFQSFQSQSFFFILSHGFQMFSLKTQENKTPVAILHLSLYWNGKRWFAMKSRQRDNLTPSESSISKDEIVIFHPVGLCKRLPLMGLILDECQSFIAAAKPARCLPFLGGLKTRILNACRMNEPQLESHWPRAPPPPALSFRGSEANRENH